MGGYHFRGAVASILGLWDGALSMPVAQDAGCECGRGCSYNGCFVAGYRSEADGTYTEMVSLAPAVKLDILVLADVGPNLFQLCKRVQNHSESVEAGVCFGCVSMGRHKRNQLHAASGHAIAQAVINLEVGKMHNWNTSASQWLSIGLLFMLFSLGYWPCVLLVHTYQFGRTLYKRQDSTVAYRSNWWSIRKRDAIHAEAELDKMQEDQFELENKPLLSLIRDRFTIAGYLGSWCAAAHRCAACCFGAPRPSIGDEGGTQAMLPPPAVQRSMWQKSINRVNGYAATQFQRAARQALQRKQDLKKAMLVGNLKLFMFGIFSVSLLTFPTAPCWMGLHATTRFVFTTANIHRSVTRHRMEEVMRPRLGRLCFTSLVFALVQSVPMSVSMTDPAGQGNSLWGAFTFSMWNYLNDNNCFMISTTGGVTTFVFSAWKTETCVASLNIWSTVASFQSVASLLLAILTARTLRIVGRVSAAGSKARAQTDSERSHEDATRDEGGRTTADSQTPSHFEQEAIEGGGSDQRCERIAYTLAYICDLCSVFIRYGRMMRYAAGALIGVAVPAAIAANFLYHWNFQTTRMVHSCVESTFTHRHCINVINVSGWICAGLLALAGVPAFSVLIGKWFDEGGLLLLLHGARAVGEAECKYHEPASLHTGEPAFATGGIAPLLGWTSLQLSEWVQWSGDKNKEQSLSSSLRPSMRRQPTCNDFEFQPGVQAIISEIMEFGRGEDKIILRYVLYAEAGSLNEIFRDCTTKLPMDYQWTAVPITSYTLSASATGRVSDRTKKMVMVVFVQCA